MGKYEELYEFFSIAGRLKETYRFGEVPAMAGKESSADHSWRLALMAMVLGDELKLKIDADRAVRIALVHDIAESLTGDVDIRLVYENKISKEEKEKEERAAMEKMCSTLAGEQKELVMELWNEYEEAKTPEARFIKALDKIEGLAHLVEFGKEGFDIAELIGLYGNNEAERFPELIPFFRVLKIKLKKLCQEKGLEWKKEYDL